MLGMGTHCWVRHLSVFKALRCAVGEVEQGAENDNGVPYRVSNRGMQKTKRKMKMGVRAAKSA